MHAFKQLTGTLLTGAALSITAWAADAPAPTNETAELLTKVIRIDTSNPPGQEGRMAEYLATLFRPLGFEVDIFPTPEAGKAHFIARLRGDGSKKPVLLAAHADVVGVEREKWSVDPFAGVVKDGYIMGRGAIDFKGGIAVFAQAVMMLAKNKVPLARDVIFMSEADEEGGKYSTRWLAQSHWDKMDCEFSLNEGGWIIKNDDGSVRYVSISTADKSGVSLVLTAKGVSTHSSMPRPDNAIFALSKAMAKIAVYDTKPMLTDSTRQFFLTLAETSKPPMSQYFYNLVNSKDPAEIDAADKEIGKDTLLHAIMRNTIAPVLMNAGFRGNVIPGSAEATLNFRTIPGTKTEDLIKEIQKVIDDPSIEITEAGFPGISAKEMAAFRSVKPSSEDSILYRALVQSAKAEFPGVPVTPYLFQAGTDASPWRQRGIPVYGIYPYPISSEDLKRMHGNDERVSIESLRQGTEMIYRTLVSVAGK